MIVQQIPRDVESWFMEIFRIQLEKATAHLTGVGSSPTLKWDVGLNGLLTSITTNVYMILLILSSNESS